MAIPASAKHRPIDQPQANVPAVDPRSGLYSMQEVQRQTRVRDYIVGMGRIIPCSCVSASNVLTLTPNDASPLLEGYRFGDCFLFVSDAASTGNVTARVALPQENAFLDTINVYKTHGTVQAGNGDILEDGVYVAAYAYHLNSNAGGLVLIGV